MEQDNPLVTVEERARLSASWSGLPRDAAPCSNIFRHTSFNSFFYRTHSLFLYVFLHCVVVVAVSLLLGYW